MGQIRDEIKNIVASGSIKRKEHKELRGLIWQLTRKLLTAIMLLYAQVDCTMNPNMLYTRETRS